jgi:hypothetical protein
LGNLAPGKRPTGQLKAMEALSTLEKLVMLEKILISGSVGQIFLALILV